MWCSLAAALGTACKQDPPTRPPEPPAHEEPPAAQQAPDRDADLGVDQAAAEPEQAAPAPSDDAPPMGAWMDTGTISLRVLGATWKDQVDGLQAPQGERLVETRLELKNRGITRLKLTPGRFRLWDRSGTQHVPDERFNADLQGHEAFLIGIQPGYTATVRLVHSVPESAEVARLVYADSFGQVSGLLEPTPEPKPSDKGKRRRRAARPGTAEKQ